MDTARMDRYTIITGEEAKNRIIEIMKGTDLGRLAMFDDEYPYVIPMNHTYYKGSLIFHGSFTGKKVDLMTRNKKATYEISYCVEEPTTDKRANCHLHFESVILHGEVAPVEDKEERREYFNAISAAYQGGIHNHSDASVNSCYAFIFRIHKASGRDGRFHPKHENKLYLYNFVK